MNRKSMALAGVLLVAAGVFGGWSLGRRGEAPHSGAPAPAVTETAPADATQPAPPAAQRRRPAPAPTATAASAAAPEAPALDDRPLLEQLPELDARARAGDARAACDLGVALSNCLRMVERRPPVMTPDYIARQPEEAQARLTEMTARMETRFERMATVCAGIERQTHLPLAQHYLLAAADGGNTVARAEFVKFPIGVADLIRAPELGRLYAAHAPRLFDAMWSEGDIAAIGVLGQAGMNLGGDMQRAAAIAVPEELRDAQLVRALMDLQMRAMLSARQLAAQPPRMPGGTPPPDAETVARAEQLWNERFEHSASVAALRDARDRPQPPPGEVPAVDRMPLFPPCDGSTPRF